jgi:type I restriction enzyme, S subunit
MSEWISEPLGDLVSFQKGRKVETSKFPLMGYERYLGAGSLTGSHDSFASTFFSVQANEK